MTVVWLALGALVGGVHGWTQQWTVARLHPGAAASGMAWVLAGAVVRWLLAAGLLLMAVLQGIGPALMALAGMIAVRWGLVLWWNRKGSVSADPLVEE
jgi:hypothetical protein